MIRIVISLSLVFAACACGAADQRREPSGPTRPVVTRAAVVPEARIPTVVPRLETEGMSCAVEGILSCPDGQIDACHRIPDSTDFHKCVPR
jgi:hypothetical protein